MGCGRSGVPSTSPPPPLHSASTATAVGGGGPAGASGITSWSITTTPADLGDFVRLHGATSVLRHIRGILSLLQARPQPRVPIAWRWGPDGMPVARAGPPPTGLGANKRRGQYWLIESHPGRPGSLLPQRAMWGSQDMRQSEALLQQPLFPDDYRCAVEHDPGTVAHHLLRQPCRRAGWPPHVALH